MAAFTVWQPFVVIIGLEVRVVKAFRFHILVRVGQSVQYPIIITNQA